MMNTHRIRVSLLSALLLFVCMCGFSISAWAGGSATISSGSNTTTIYWNEKGDVRMGVNGAKSDSYILVHDGTPYMIMNSGDEPMAMNLQKTAERFGQAAETSATKVISFKATGKHETIAGVRGDVYEMVLQDADGKKETHELVIAGDARAVALSKAFVTVARAVAGASQESTKIMNHLPKKKRGLLRADDSFKVISLSAAAPAESLFAMPETVTDPSTMLHDQINEAVEEQKQQQKDDTKRRIKNQIRRDVRHGVRHRHRRFFP